MVSVGSFLIGARFVEHRVEGSQTRENARLYVESPEGVVPAKIASGIPEEDLIFLRNFRGKLIPEIPKSTHDLREQLKKQLAKDFQRDKHIILTRFPKLTERETLAMYLLLRVHGSMPVYAVLPVIPPQLEKLLLSPEGNCSGHSVRLMMAMDVFGFSTAMLPIFTPSLPGHIVVDVHDPVEGTGYILDSNTNMFIYQHDLSESMMTYLLTLDLEGRQQIFNKANDKIIELPLHFRFVDPGEHALSRTLFTADYLNEKIVAYRKIKWIETFTTEMSKLVAWWKETKSLFAPRTLAELQQAYALNGLAKFAPVHGVATQAHWLAAGLEYEPLIATQTE